MCLSRKARGEGVTTQAATETGVRVATTCTMQVKVGYASDMYSD